MRNSRALLVEATADAVIASLAGRIPAAFSRRVAKRRAELSYWKRRVAAEGSLDGAAYERFFTAHFGLDAEDYAGKRVLDIGCGPRGSLEWATQASERVGLDPLAGAYLRLGSARHAMSYVEGTAEHIPFADEHFDVVASFNSLDHVDQLDRAVAEIGRVTRPGGLLLLITDVGHAPTFTEPQAFSWDVLDRFSARWEVVRSQCFEKVRPNMMESLDARVELAAGSESKTGILSALLRRRSSEPAQRQESRR
jgi:SAM-dependent methyltransferase